MHKNTTKSLSNSKMTALFKKNHSQISILENKTILKKNVSEKKK